MRTLHSNNLHLSLLAVLLGVAVALPSAAFAQDEDDPQEEDDDEPEEEEEPEEEGSMDEEDNKPSGVDLDREEETARARRQRETQEGRKKRPVREIVKGAYLKVNLGPLFWLPAMSNFTNTTGTEMDFSFGYDVVDTLGFTLSIEGSFFQVITNGHGVSMDPQSDPRAANSPIQGDFRIFGGTASVRAAANIGGRRVKRFSISGHGGGGVGYSPALVDLTNPEVVARITFANSEGARYIMQDRPLGLIQGGLGLEYYTRLSHFSVGLDIDFNVILGGPIVAMGLATNAFAKYTF
jgi:hypothetical protein